MTGLMEFALSFYGLKEVPGTNHNATILGFFKAIGSEWVSTDETAWCAAFVNYCCLTILGEQTGKLNARSFLNFGEKTTDPQVGDIVVLWRGSRDSWMGHVGFYIKHDSEYIYMLGGNQGNEVNISKYPIERVLEYRRP